MEDGFAKERLDAYEDALIDERLTAIRRRPRGRSRFGEDPPLPTPPPVPTDELLRRAHVEHAIRNHSEAIKLAREVEDRGSGAQRVDALRVRARAHAAIAEWFEAIESGRKALELEPEVDAELPELIERWRSILDSRLRREAERSRGSSLLGY
jgi:hypothetical protein